MAEFLFTVAVVAVVALIFGYPLYYAYASILDWRRKQRLGPAELERMARVELSTGLLTGEKIVAALLGTGSLRAAGPTPAGDLHDLLIAITSRRLLWLHFNSPLDKPRDVLSRGAVSIEDVAIVQHSANRWRSVLTADLPGGSRLEIMSKSEEAVREFETVFAAARATAQPGGPGIAAELTALAELHRAGVLDEGDWAQARARFLGTAPSEQEQAAQTLTQLHDLHRRGVLSESEFNMKKWDVLARRSGL